MTIENAARAAIATACLSGSLLTFGAIALAPTSAQAAPFSLSFDILVADQGLDGIYRSRDLNGDGDANDAGETSVYFNGDNASGLSNPSSSVFTILQSRSGHLYVGDGTSDSVYRLFDDNRDGDAQDRGEATLWLSEENAAGLTLPTPNGIGEDSENNVYIVNAGTRSSPSDGIYKTRDLNGDGDANDAGEASLWLDLARLNPSSSAFEITFQGNVAFVADTVGGDSNVIYRAEDSDGNGTIDDSEVSVFIDGNNPYGATIDFALAGDDTSLYVWEFLDIGEPQSLFKLTDMNGSGVIDDVLEVVDVWDTTLLPSGTESFAGFGVAVDEHGNVILTSNGRDANQDNVFLLQDLNGDGDYRDEGETGVWLSREASGDVPDRPRAVAFVSQNTLVAVPEPGTLPLMAAGFLSIFGLAGFSRQRRASAAGGA